MEAEVLEVDQAAKFPRDDARQRVALELQLLQGRQEPQLRRNPPCA